MNNYQEENILKTIYLVEVGEYDTRQIIGAYSQKNIAESVLGQSKDIGRIIPFELETSPNTFTVYEMYKIDDKLSSVHSKRLSVTQFRDFIKFNPCKFRICWRKGYKAVSSEPPREFGCFNAWGMSEEECRNSMIKGLIECEEYNE